MSKILEDRITNLAKYYRERGHLIRELRAALENIKESNCLDDAKEIAILALNIIMPMSDDTYSKLGSNSCFVTLLPEYLDLELRKTIFTVPLTKEKILELHKSLGIK